ncbi:MAG TPA: bacillithiol biosynthesis deacetylase BshB1 [Candidatus Kapabacteria bacterium]|nr:bacillithiol biosynthesis deacetylase BshB1 [Candidatus Kapabacteria bacterium]
MNIDILAFAAHPDDVEFSCAGTMILMRRKGYKTGAIDLTRGELGTRGTARSRAREAEAAAKIMGLTVRKNLGMPDGNIELTQKNILKIISVVREYRPRIVLMPYHVERHPDHEHASRLIREALFYSGLKRIPTNISGDSQEPHRPEMTLCYQQTAEMPISVVVDITSVFEERMQAAYAYATQVHNPKMKGPETFISRPEFLEHIEARARENGFSVGVKYGEGFYQQTPVWAEDLFTLLPQKPRFV